jgi:hypothetical protein
MRSIDEYSDMSEYCIQDARIRLTTSGVAHFSGQCNELRKFSQRRGSREDIISDFAKRKAIYSHSALIRLGPVKLVPVCDNFHVANNLIPFR